MLLAFAMTLPGTAIAHTTVVKESPSGKADRSVSRAAVTFSGVIRRGTLRVTSASGRVVSKGRGARDPRDARRVVVPLRKLSPGKYVARWKIVAADGHVQTGGFSFRVRR
jgi:methionine-rich copper-binding protein CopC